MMHAGGAGGNRDDGSSDPWKRKGDKKKKKDDKPKERKRGFGVAKLEIIRIQSELAEQKRKNELAEQEKRQNAQQGPPQIPDGTTDGLDIAAIRGSVYPWSMHANVAPSLPPPAHYSPHLAMHYGSEGMGAMNFGQSQSTPLRFPGASGPYPAPNNIRPLGAPAGTIYPPNPNNIRPPGTFGASSYSNTNIISGPPGASGAAAYYYYPNNPNNISPPGAFGAAYYPYSNNIMLPANEVTMAQPLSQVPNSQELIDLMREGGHSTSAGESTSKNSDEDPEGLDLELRL
ncbi:hypothetical protein DAI22_05g260000 [Oryza sativa Japonica Group]|nr:hypothetical protein DAI22_05g260000 [Oryza sativa Japonica Group]